MEKLKEPLLKKSITVGEVLSLAIALLAAGIVFYTTVQVRLSSLELRMQRTEQEQTDYKVKQTEFQNRLEGKIDAIKDDISNIKIDNAKNKKQ